MKILILVLSCKKPPYDTLYEAQRRTWDSVDVSGVVTRYFWCDEVAVMPGVFRRTLDDSVDLMWDFIFRMNSSSYVDKVMLKAFAETLPRERCYCGIDGGGFASGSGFFLSRDMVEVLRRGLPERHDGLIEDQVAGQVLTAAGFSVSSRAERYDFWQREFERGFYGRSVKDEEAAIRAAYHVRCKSNDADRGKDVVAFEAVHRIKMEGT